MRLIDADEIFYDQLLNTGCKEHPLELAVSKKRIDDMPTIEPQQEIVHCRDCKHYIQTSCPMTGTWATDEDYCSFGERGESQMNLFDQKGEVSD